MNIMKPVYKHYILLLVLILVSFGIKAHCVGIFNAVFELDRRIVGTINTQIVNSFFAETLLPEKNAGLELPYLNDIQDSISGNVYAIDQNSEHQGDKSLIQAIRIDEIKGDMLLIKYKIGTETFLDVDFMWREAVGAYHSLHPLTYGDHAQFKSNARLIIKKDTLVLQFAGKTQKLLFKKLYHKAVNLETHRDPYHAEDGFSTDIPFEELMTNLVRSCNASVLKKFKGVQIRINDIATNKIVIELYVTNNNSEDISGQETVDHSVGWLEYYPYENKLLDITNDPEEPEILKYNKKVVEHINFDSIFGYKKKE